MTRTALIVAGGKGLRMGSDLPKQFLPIGGKPVLMHTIEAFYRFDEEMKIVLVLPQEQQTYWRELCQKYHFSIGHVLADGGETRFHSVKNGLAYVEPGLVGVHDGVRPFVSRQVIERCYQFLSLTWWKRFVILRIRGARLYLAVITSWFKLRKFLMWSY